MIRKKKGKSLPKAGKFNAQIRVTPTIPKEVMQALIQFRKDNFLKSENMVASMAIVVFLKKHGYLNKDFKEVTLTQ